VKNAWIQTTLQPVTAFYGYAHQIKRDSQGKKLRFAGAAVYCFQSVAQPGSVPAGFSMFS